MPRCKYCGTVPFATYCPSYFHHVTTCRSVRDKYRNPPTPIVINNHYTYHQTTQIQINQLYIDYPKSSVADRVLSHAKTFDVKLIKSVTDLDAIMGEIQEANGREILRYLEGSDLLAKSQALSFLADVMRTIRMRISKEKPIDLELLDAAKQFEEDCLEDKKRLTAPKSSLEIVEVQ